MRSPGKQIACMIGINITSDIYRLSPRRGGVPRFCFFCVCIKLLLDTVVASMEELLVNIWYLEIKDNPT